MSIFEEKPILEPNIATTNGLDSLPGIESNLEISEEPKPKELNLHEDFHPPANHFLRPNRLKKRDFLSKSHCGHPPKRLRKHKPSNRRREDAEEKKEENCREIHLKEEENTDKRQFYHSYMSFASIMEYLDKFEWFNNASFQNKQLPIKYLTPICFWFITCYNYFPRHMLTKSVTNFVEATLAKVARIVPETKIRLNKNLIKNVAANSLAVSQPDPEGKPEKCQLNDFLDSFLSPFQPDNVQRHFERRQIQKNSYTAEDDLFLSQIKRFAHKKSLEFQAFLERSAFEPSDFLRDSGPSLEEERAVLNGTETEKVCDSEGKNNAESIEKAMNNGVLGPELPKKSAIGGIANSVRSMDLESNRDPSNIDEIPIGKISLNNLISLYSLDLDSQRKENELMIRGLIDKIELEKRTQTMFLQEEGFADEMLYDISFFTREERDYLNYLENKQQNSHFAKNSSATPIKDPSQPPAFPKIKVYTHTEDTVCQICNDGDYIDENLIVFCSKCNISVHQFCYGIPVIPHGDWICDLCRDLGPSGKFLRCPLCMEIGGAMKKTVINCETGMFASLNPGFQEFLHRCERSHKSLIKPEAQINEESQDPIPFDVWAHITCVLWLPETYFQDKLSYLNVRGLENIDPKKFESFCAICETSSACVQCAKSKCQISFHPECARRAKLSMEVKLTEKLTYYIYCEKHTPLKLKRLLENKEKKYQEEIVKFSRTIEKYFETYNSEHKARTSQLLKSKKILKKFFKKPKLEQTKDTRFFLSALRDHFYSFEENRFMVVLSKREEDSITPVFENPEVLIPRVNLSMIPRHDHIWKSFTYKSLSPEQIYKKYYSILKRQGVVRAKAGSEEKPAKIEAKPKESPKKSVSKQKFPPQREETEDLEKVYCICKRKYGEGEPMMECEACLEWFHFECIGFSGSLEEAEHYHFVCPICKKSSRRSSPDKQKTPEKAVAEGKPNGKASREKNLKSTAQKKEDDNGEGKGKDDTVPVCKRTRKQLVNTQVSISSSTPRKESKFSPKSGRKPRSKRLEERKRTKLFSDPIPDLLDSEDQGSETKPKKRKVTENVRKRLRKK